MSRDHIAGKPITGAHYVPSCGCEVPPWEVCPCSALMPRLQAGPKNLELWDEAQRASFEDGKRG